MREKKGKLVQENWRSLHIQNDGAALVKMIGRRWWNHGRWWDKAVVPKRSMVMVPFLCGGLGSPRYHDLRLCYPRWWHLQELTRRDQQGHPTAPLWVCYGTLQHHGTQFENHRSRLFIQRSKKTRYVVRCPHTGVVSTQMETIQSSQPLMGYIHILHSMYCIYNVLYAHTFIHSWLAHVML